MVDWRGHAHPSDDPLPVLDLRLQHPDPVHVRQVLGALGAEAEAEVGTGRTPQVVATVSTLAGTVVLGAPD